MKDVTKDFNIIMNGSEQKNVALKDTVLNIIKRACSEKEIVRNGIESSMVIKNSHSTYIPDIFLPRGCSALGFQPNTIVEVKTILLPDTLYRISKIYENLPEGYSFVLVFGKTNGVVKDIREKLRNSTKQPEHFSIFSARDFLKKM